MNESLEMLAKRTGYSNIPLSIETKLGKSKHNQKNHPVEIVKNLIYEYFQSLPEYKFTIHDNMNPVVSVADNFDKLLIPKDHPARSRSDTYYVNEDTVLRTHTSAHQNELLSQGLDQFLVTGDVYRKDEIDRHHYPVFHQTEGVARVPNEKDPQEELIKVLGGLVQHLFPNAKYRINPDYFPFTEPSFEIEVEWNGRWLEILGCGVMQPAIASANGFDEPFWAFGLGLERLALILFDIPDIRYLWSDDPKFLDQFSSGQILKFKPYSELPNQFNDISFWIPETKIVNIVDKECNPEIEKKKTEILKWIDDNDFYETAREVGGDLIEEVKLMDEFYHPKKKMHSRMYRIVYSPNVVSTNDPGEFTRLVNKIQDQIREKVSKLDLILR